MTRIAEIEDEIKEAMKARDAERRDALRLIVNALKNSSNAASSCRSSVYWMTQVIMQ